MASDVKNMEKYFGNIGKGEKRKKLKLKKNKNKRRFR